MDHIETPETEPCERCTADVATATGYSRQEWIRFGGRRVKVTAYYCPLCAAVLGATSWPEAEVAVDPITKQD